ncbi:MAG: malate synthase A, partial [Verrucomicrobia bacterium]
MITAKKRFTAEALEFISDLHRRFNPTRLDLLRRRVERQAHVDRGKTLRFRPETRRIRDDSWNIAAVPADLDDRRVEITGPTDRKMMINALNSGAKTFMADFEDANTPAWRNVVEGQANLRDAVRRTIVYV